MQIKVFKLNSLNMQYFTNHGWRKAVDFVSEHRPEIATAFLGAGALLDAKLIYATAAGFLSSSPVMSLNDDLRKIEVQRKANEERTLLVEMKAESLFRKELS